MIGTFVIPAYNREDTIDRAIRSVAQQGLSGYEVIVTDDASTDNTLKVAKAWSNRYPENVIVLPFKDHSERVITVNSGIRYARGEWIIVFDSDDELASHFIKAFEDARATYPQARFFSWGSLFHHHTTNPTRYVKTQVFPTYHPPIDAQGKIGVFRAGGITMGAFAFQKKLVSEKGYLPGKTNCYSQGEAFLKWYPEIKPLYNEGQTDLGNPWGNDFMMAYHYSRGLNKDQWVPLDQILHLKHHRV